jgi:hypothetical protein
MDGDEIGLAVEPLPGAVGAQIVDHNDLVDRAVLGADRGDAARERVEAIEGRHGGGDSHASVSSNLAWRQSARPI